MEDLHMHSFHAFKTLPDLQAHLDHLRPGDQLSIPSADYARLFGENDAAMGRMKNFALAHGCTISWTTSGPVLSRLPQQVPAPRAGAEL
ncbi:MAG TPA: hypothetical protein VHN20_12780 [Beijerinckiaceae bacterium]|nr:hypothetical protein [Beijerinckiaceae bacterium]